jgi:hypothetical protein
MVMVCLLSGCGGYVLRGKVVEGPEPGVRVVSANDREMERPGIGGARVEVVVDPMSLGRRVVEPVETDSSGEFAVPIEEFGAGSLEYEASVVARRGGFRHVAELIALPGGDRRVLIVLTPGTDGYRPPDDPLGESREFLRRAK